MPKNEEQQLRTLRQLMEMFRNIPVERILVLCEQNKWNIDICIDELVNYNKHLKNNLNQQQRGAIPKITSSTKKLETQIPLISPQQNSSKTNRKNTTISAIVETRILDHIICGHKVMILMRGAPGSGKSVLAKSMLERFVADDYKCKPCNFILSTDDFWIQPNGRYIFNRDRLTEAHKFNQYRARQKASAGWSPIIIDNTNMMIWEMMPYVEIAVRHSYIVELLEPNTPWRNSAKQLSKKNHHGVPRDSIQIMLDKYECTTPQQLTNMLKRSMYIESLPQYRSYPPLLDNVQQLLKSQSQQKSTLNPIIGLQANNTEHIKEKKNELHCLEKAKQEDTRECNCRHCGVETDEIDSRAQTFLLFDDSNEDDYYNSSGCCDKASVLSVQSDDAEATNNNSFVVDKGQSIYKTKNYEYASITYKNDIQDKHGCSNINCTSSMSEYEFDEGGYTSNDTDLVDNKNIWNKTSSKRKSKKLLVTKNVSNVNVHSFVSKCQTTPKNERNKFHELELVSMSSKSLPAPGLTLVTKSSNDMKKTLWNLLEEKSSGFAQEPSIDPPKDSKKICEMKSFDRHSVDCINEHQSFVSLRQIYPNKNLTALWDLFLKCNGDIDWAIDILLGESEMASVNQDDDIIVDNFVCQCEKHGADVVMGKTTLELESSNSASNACNPKPQRQRKNRSNSKITPKVMEIKATIENKIVIGEEYYTDSMKKMRCKNNNGSNSSNNNESFKFLRHVGTQTDLNEDEPSDDDNSKNLLEVTFNEDIVSELHSVFRTELTMDQVLPQIPSMKIFVPRHLAKELYMLWVESVYNHMEDQRQQVILEDEQFARLLKNPKYQNCTEVPSNLTELLDMEMALMIYNNDTGEVRNKKEEHYIDLATHLKQMKLSEMFVDIPRDTLEYILATNNNDYSHTVEMLSKMKDNNMNMVVCEEKYLIERAIRENKLLNERMSNWDNDGLLSMATVSSHIEIKQSDQTKHIKTQNDDDDIESRDSSIPPDEAKRLALISFEGSRNMAAHHCQLKAECFFKAKQAIQKGNGGVAMFYSEVASLHKKKVEMYNHMAANAIVNVHKYTQNNPDLLDLHYLHVPEALNCLDVFLDRHIANLRKFFRPYKHVFVITGRGLHSVRGVSTIKSKVKTRLKDRNLRWTDVNPGLLKIKIFSASRHSRNFS